MRTVEQTVNYYKANEWTNPKTGDKRYYIRPERAFNMEIERYKSGNIDRAFVNDEKISNTLAYELLAHKIWFDDKLALYIHNSSPFDASLDHRCGKYVKEFQAAFKAWIGGGGDDMEMALNDIDESYESLDVCAQEARDAANALDTGINFPEIIEGQER